MGARVVLLGRRQPELDQTRGLLSGEGHHVAVFDLESAEGLPALLKQLGKDCGLFAGVAHCAGIHSLRPVKMESVEHAESMLRTNTISSLMLVKAARQRGVRAEALSIVLVSSVMGSQGQPGLAAYCASKGALEALARASAVELAREGIRVNCVAPGIVQTDMTARFRNAIGEESFAAARSMHPLGLGVPRDVSTAIAFLLADASRWITGTTLVVDGGYSAQ
jgi:NAD(P)-dependent dehydrogenase (short-subunit alcohol dehydrogenase family)